MAIYQLPSETSYNFSNGLDQYFLYLGSQIPNLYNYIIGIIYLIVLLGGYMGTKKTEGRNDFALWMLVAGFVTFPAALILFLINGIVSLATIIILISVTIVGGIIYFSSSHY